MTRKRKSPLKQLRAAGFRWHDRGAKAGVVLTVVIPARSNRYEGSAWVNGPSRHCYRNKALVSPKETHFRTKVFFAEMLCLTTALFYLLLSKLSGQSQCPFLFSFQDLERTIRQGVGSELFRNTQVFNDESFSSLPTYLLWTAICSNRCWNVCRIDEGNSHQVSMGIIMGTHLLQFDKIKRRNYLFQLICPHYCDILFFVSLSLKCLWVSQSLSKDHLDTHNELSTVLALTCAKRQIEIALLSKKQHDLWIYRLLRKRKLPVLHVGWENFLWST